MSKPVKISLPETLRSTTCTDVDWSRCCICQNNEETGNLCCPTKNPIPKQFKCGYDTISTILEELQNLNYILPSGLPIKSLNQGEGLLQTLITNQAKWHKACYTKHTGIHLVRLKKKLESKISFEDNASSSASHTRSSGPLPPVKDELCLFCSRSRDWKEPLINVATLNMIQNIENYAHELQDTRLLAILSAGDLVAQEAKYHKSCLTQLYNRYTNRCKKNNTQDDDTDQNVCEGMAFSELIYFITRKLQSQETDYLFKIPDLISMYQERLVELLGIPKENLPLPHSTRFRDKILTFLPQLKQIKSGREYCLVRTSADVCKEFDLDDYDRDAIAFKRFVRNVRKTIMENPTKFEGKLKKPENEVSQGLLAVVNAILYGSFTRDIGRHTKPALAICEMIMYNMKSKRPIKENIRHSSASEPSIPVYIGLQMHNKFRAKGFIDKLHELGISISSHRVMEITSSYSELVVRRCEEEKVLCPSNFKTGLFTVAAIDNVDHNPSSISSTGSFHGTSLSLYQLGTLQNTGSERTPHINYTDVEISGNLKVPILPDHYGLVKDYTLYNKHPSIPIGSETLTNNIISSEPLDDTWKNETHWLEHIKNKITDRDLNKNDISWAAYHSSKVQNILLCPSISALLPLFHEHAANAAMIHHGMRTIQKITAYVHPDQVPVMCADQPLYTLGKLIQWNCPEQFGEDKFVLLFGPFHIEQNFLKVLGQLLTGSGWVDIVASSGIIEKGSAEAILKVVHVTKARAMHQVTAAVLYSFLKETYETNEPDEHKSMDDWLSEVTTEFPTAMFWFRVLNLEILLLTFVRAVREGNFTLYKESLQKMMPWFFVFDHSNYARWLAVHLKDLDELAEKVPSVHEEFNNNGNFVVRKTGRPFSALGIDQAHEQYNAEIKGSGGAIGLTQDPASLRRFTIAGPEISALLKEFQSSEFKDTQKLEGHHDQNLSYQKNILNRCVALKTSFEEAGNPFKEHGTELIALDTRVVATSAAVKTLFSMEKTGNEQYKTFVKERLVDRTKSLYDPIKKNSTKFFDHKAKRIEPLDKIKSLKVDIQLYSRLFIIARERELNLKEFFQYENQSCPPSLSANGRLRSGNKADLAERLELLPESVDAPPSKIDGIIWDGAALVQMCVPKHSKTFKEYYTVDLKPRILHLLQNLNCKRIDIVWDIYLPNSLKGQEREARGTGIRRQVTPNGSLPRNWSDFLRNDQNKSDLFGFLGGEFINSFSDAVVVTNLADQVSASDGSCTSIANKKIPWHMEEADGRIVCHAKDMAGQGATHILVRSSDTDVLVLLISYYKILKDEGLQELWMLTGTANKRRYIAVHKIATSLGHEMSTALRGFHSFTGCDTTSYFNTKGKKTCFKTWMSHSEITTAFANISTPIEILSEEVMADLERFTCRLYDAQTEHITVNELRKELFASKNRPVTSLPPTSASLRQHALRAAFQAGHIWGNQFDFDILIPSPSCWGWNDVEGSWTPQWSRVTSIWPELSLLDHCGCKSGCDTMRCGCRRVGLRCTLQCKICKGQCQNKTVTSVEIEDELC